MSKLAHAPTLPPFIWTLRTDTEHQHFGYLLAGLGLERDCLLTAQHALTLPTSAEREAVEQYLSTLDLSGSPVELSHLLADAIAWSDKSGPARDAESMLVEYFHSEYGLLVDTRRARIARAPDFDSAEAHSRRCEELHRARAADAMRTGRAMLEKNAALPSTVMRAAERLLTVAVGSDQARALERALREVGVPGRLCEEIVFAVAYAAGEDSGLDLVVDSPVLVDPAEEAKGEIAAQIRTVIEPDPYSFGDPPTAAEILASREFRQAAAVLSGTDRALVESTLRRLDATATDPSLWLPYLSRAELGRSLHLYCAGMQTLQGYAQWLGSDLEGEVQPLAHRWMATLAGELVDLGRRLSEQARSGHGLIDMERQQIVHTLRGALLGQPAPALLFVGERFKARHEFSMHTSMAGEPIERTQHQLVAMIKRGGIDLPHIELDNSRRHKVDNTVRYVEPDASVLAVVESLHGLILPTGDSEALAEHTAAAARLQTNLAEAGAPEPLRDSVDALVADAAESAYQAGARSQTRSRQWEQRIAAVVRTGTPPGASGETNTVSAVHANHDSLVEAAWPDADGTVADDESTAGTPEHAAGHSAAPVNPDVAM
ncbi:hypothetical protein C5E45_23905 [Nocardia nova]|uniref:Uncharacterized protein n=1 Tax=Nocardia nova TaxID=37330 RepID=A0A2S6AKT5_9NOCA|nr:hypothetical protein [Nocardia nova]PPJ35851.1 hypothetical protein C5E45_23905 [Nocardia nova]